jgi:hypothetical protein
MLIFCDCVNYMRLVTVLSIMTVVWFLVDQLALLLDDWLVWFCGIVVLDLGTLVPTGTSEAGFEKASECWPFVSFLCLPWCWYPIVNGLGCSILILAWVSVVLGLIWTNTTLDQFDPCSFCVELISGLPKFVPVRNSGFTSWMGYSNGLLAKGYYLCWLVLCMATA